jgi:SAM-dependent methyltransferase
MAASLVDFLQTNGVRVDGGQVASIGCGDGAITVGIAHQGSPSLIVGFDWEAPDADRVLERARQAGVGTSLPPAVHFERFESGGIPAAEATFDAALVALNWGEIEQLAGPVAGVGRVLRPGGVLAVMLSRDWPARLPAGPDGVAAGDGPSLEAIQGMVLAAGLDLVAVTMDAPVAAVPAGQSWAPLATLAVRSLAILARAPAGRAGSLSSDEPR